MPAREDLDHPQIGKRSIRLLMLAGAVTVLGCVILMLTLNSGANAT